MATSVPPPALGVRTCESLVGSFVRLTRAGYIDTQILRERYQAELRPYLLSKHTWHDKTLELWLQMVEPNI